MMLKENNLQITHTRFDSNEIGKIWESNASAWINLSENGHDPYRDYVNNPAFLKLLPNIKDLTGLDIGCGAGYNTNLLTQYGALLTGLDISPSLINYAKTKYPHINFLLGNAAQMPFEDRSFDFITSFHCLMDIPEYEQTISEIYRILKNTAFFQFSIPHPCFWTHKMKWRYDEEENKELLLCKPYFHEDNSFSFNYWGNDNLEPAERKNITPLKTPLFYRTLSQWTSALLQTGFSIEAICEPKGNADLVRKFPALAGCNSIAYSIIFKCAKK